MKTTILRVFVLVLFAVSIMVAPGMTSAVMAADEAAAAAAGAASTSGTMGGGLTAAGIGTGTIAAGVGIAAIVGVALASKGGESRTVATPSTAGTDLAKTDPAAAGTVSGCNCWRRC